MLWHWNGFNQWAIYVANMKLAWQHRHCLQFFCSARTAVTQAMSIKAKRHAHYHVAAINNLICTRFTIWARPKYFTCVWIKKLLNFTPYLYRKLCGNSWLNNYTAIGSDCCNVDNEMIRQTRNYCILFYIQKVTISVHIAWIGQAWRTIFDRTNSQML